MIDNAVYDRLGERWYAADDDPIALLRAEARLRNPWIEERIARERGAKARVLDVGCGGGFLSNHLARAGFEVTGLDASAEALAVAARHDATGRVGYVRGDGCALPFEPGSFDAVCAMDFLEHVEHPARVVTEAARVLRPSGLFFFHTFNRNPIAWLVVIKGVEWFVRNTPRDMHVLELFVKPEELRAACDASGLEVIEMLGVRPALDRAFFSMLATGVVPGDFAFVETKSLACGYFGWAKKHLRAR